MEAYPSPSLSWRKWYPWALLYQLYVNYIFLYLMWIRLASLSQVVDVRWNHGWGIKNLTTWSGNWYRIYRNYKTKLCSLYGCLSQRPSIFFWTIYGSRFNLLVVSEKILAVFISVLSSQDGSLLGCCLFWNLSNPKRHNKNKNDLEWEFPHRPE